MVQHAIYAQISLQYPPIGGNYILINAMVLNDYRDMYIFQVLQKITTLLPLIV